MIIIKSKQKKSFFCLDLMIIILVFFYIERNFKGDLKIKLCGKRLNPTEIVKYLGVKIDRNLTWQHHVNDISIKLNRANALLFKMRKYVSIKI